MKKQVNINSNSIESRAKKDDFRKAVSEYIWNGFDAKASELSIEFTANDIGHIHFFSVRDNGEGIKYSTIEDTFGLFLDSNKTYHQRSSQVKGKDGEGRFAFVSFAKKAVWKTICIDDGKCKQYDIIITKDSAHEFDITDNAKVTELKKTSTGTTVFFYELYKIDGNQLNSADFKNYLIEGFGWFLHLNRQADFKILINGEELPYKELIADNEDTNIEVEYQGNTIPFKVLYIRWREKIQEKSNFYYLNSNRKEVAKQPTSFNNKTNDFFHSVYIESDYFNDFRLVDEAAQDLFGEQKNQNHPVFKSFIRQLKKFVEEKEKGFIRLFGAENLIQHYEKEKLLPEFKSNRYDQERKQDLIAVVKGIYCIHPKIFQGLKAPQAKTCIGFLNLILDTDERENVIDILGTVVSLTSDERGELITLLKKTSLQKIIRTIKLIEDRFKTIELLKALVFELKKFTTERDHIQVIVESNYWLFGEEYHLVSADSDFEVMLAEYLHFLDSEQTDKKATGGKKKVKIDHEENKRRPDIFLCRKRDIPDNQFGSGQLEENILVELKRPTVTIGKEQLRQIEDYLEFIVKEEKFNSQTRQWKFIVVSNKVDDYVKQQYEENKIKGKRFLVKAWGSLEVYAMTWDDVFQGFNIRHKHLLNTLEYDKTILIEELQLRGIQLNTESSEQLTLLINNPQLQ